MDGHFTTFHIHFIFVYITSCTFTAKEVEGESPKFLQPLKSQEVFEGSAAKLEVRITGEPEPDIEWFKDEQPIEEGDNFRIEFDDTDGCVLVINSAKLEDEGMYRCVASNSLGKAISEAQFLVTGKKFLLVVSQMASGLMADFLRRHGVTCACSPTLQSNHR